MTEPIQPSAKVARPRLPGLDVTRAIALIGVVVMNYHGYLNGGDDLINRSLAERIFDPFQGPLSTRFAATFVLVAGMGVTLLTNRGRLAKDKGVVREDRWRLAQRGLLLYSAGFVVEWIWSGTILFFYGAFFIVGSLLFTLRIRWLVLIGATSALIAAWVQWWRIDADAKGHFTFWLDPNPDTPRNLLLRTFIGHTHPLFPWLAFFCAGIILARYLPLRTAARSTLIAIGVVLVALTYAINHFATPDVEDAASDRWRMLLSTRPFDRGLLYTVGTLGSSLVAFCLISWLADQFPSAGPTRWFQHAGQMTLTLYVLHVLTFNYVVHWKGWIRPTGLDTALAFAVGFWVFAIAFGGLWHKRFGAGPLERIYRGFGG